MLLKDKIQITLFCSLFLASPILHALNLSEAVSLALKNDADYQIATAEYMAAKEKHPQSLSDLLPSIELNLFASDTSGEITASGVTTNNDFSSNGYAITLSQTLFNKKLFDALDQSEAEVAQALVSFQAAKLSIIIRTATAYFEILAAKDNLDYAISENLAISRQLEQSTERFNAGLIAITDVKESQAQFDIAAAQEIAAENKLTNSKEALYLLINSTVDKVAALDETIPLLIPEPDDMQQWQDNAIQNNLELRAAYYALTAANEAVSGSKSGHYPTLDLSLVYNNQSSDGSSLGAVVPGRDTADTRVLLNLDIPIYSGGYTSSKQREALANLDKASAILNSQKRLAVQQTRNAFRGIKTAIAQAHAFKKALESTQSASEATQSGFEVGTRNSVDVLLALREQHKSERDYSRALYDYILNVLELKKSAGTLSENDIQQINSWFTH